MQWKLGTLIAGAQVQSLVGELRPHNMCDVAKYIYLNGNLVKAMVFLVVMYGYEIWTIKKAECWRTVVLEKALESPLDCKEIQPVYPRGNQSWIFIGRTDAEAPILWPHDAKNWLFWKRPWYWERLKVGGEVDDRGWDGWMVSLTRTWVWASSKSWWWTGKPGVLQCMGSKELDTAEWLNWTVSLMGKGMGSKNSYHNLVFHSSE